jgi:ribosomal protein L11 methyltransferase
LEIYAPEELPAELVDTVLANILAGPLIALAPRLIGLLRPAGDVVLSGVLADQVESVRDAYAQQIELAPTRLREEWALIYGQKSLF